MLKVAKYVVFGFICALYPFFCGAEELSAVWERTNPGGGGAWDTIGAGPTGIIIAGSDLSGAYRSLDGGRTWDVIGAARGLTVTDVCGVGFDPADPSIIYLGTEEGLFRSADSGETFTQVLGHGYITDIAFSPSDPQVGYAAHHSRYDLPDGTVYRSTDRGRTWRRVSGPSLPRGLHILELFTDPRNGKVVYALTGEGRFACGPAALFVSRDGGASWRRVGAELGQIAHAVLDPRDPDVLYVTTYGDVWDSGYRCVHDDPRGGWLYRGRYTGGKWKWERLTQDLGSRNLWVWPDADDAHALRVIDMDWPEIWESTDGGRAWTWIGDKEEWDPGWTGVEFAYGTSFNGDAKTLAFDPSDPDALLWADSQFLWATRDDGRTFGPLHTDEVSPGRWRSRGADNIVTFGLALSADSTHVYLAMPDLGCFRSPDGGESWVNCNDPRFVGTWDGYGGNSMTVAADPTRPSVVWITQAEEIVGSPHTLLRSTDYGASWEAVGEGLPDGIPSGLSVDPGSPVHRRILFITVNGEVWRSGDDGDTFQLVLRCGGCRYTAVDPHDGSVIYAGGEAGLWRSLHGGYPGTWERIGPPEMRGDLGNEFWESFWAWAGVSSIKPDPLQPGSVYVAVFGEGRGLYRSRDRGNTWEKLSDDRFVRDVAIFPTDPDLILVATGSALYSGGYHPASRGVLLSRDGGYTWKPLNRGLEWPFARALVIDPNSPRTIWLASPGTGYHRITLEP